MNSRAVAVLLALVVTVVGLGVNPATGSAHHRDERDHAYLWPYAVEGGGQWIGDQMEMNARTTSGQSIPLRFVSGDGLWLSAYAKAFSNWNTAMSPITGYYVFSNETTTGYIDFTVGTSSICFTQTAHGCVRYWNPATPSGTISMNSTWFTLGSHRISDVMHELGHVLWNANEHYLTSNNCLSIMGHSAIEGTGGASGMYCGTGTGSDIITAVQPHDVDDYLAAYSVRDAPDWSYPAMYGAATIVHWFEGGYLSGNGITLHQEWLNRLDRSTAGLNGGYSYYHDGPRKVANADDANPENDAYSEVPAVSGEWCFKRYGMSGGVTGGLGYQSGPSAKIYCIARSGPGSGICVTSSRNGDAGFRVWNFSGATALNVQLRTDPPPGNQICNLGDIPNNSASFLCWSPIAGPGYLTLWYNNAWVAQDTIGYDQ